MSLLRKWPATSNSGGPAVGARIVPAFQAPVGVQNHSARLAHRVGIAFIQNGNVVASGNEAIDQIAVKTRLYSQVSVGRAPGPSEQPARRIERLVERLTENDVTSKYRRLALRLPIAAHSTVGNDAPVFENCEGGVQRMERPARWLKGVKRFRIQ